ncbi:DUF1552 domain-containing protein [Alienimonas californiensis]|uniref:DUF1552 domain-containing protein n=1 Tax=Alienimonas californiensis TaxID=2527989 RepID=A0A517P6L1_9PLAN|nr:DUF1552 domain-containing protein [Alienimonas californiensis]QDT15004.1 hypothetical protein CA12_10840 [Alienimonas californiensis]
MFVARRALPRRTLLKGAGAAVGLPLLEAMTPALTAQEATPAAPAALRRLGFVYMPMGCDPSRWMPEGGTPGGEALGALPPTLEPLEAVRDRVSVVGNLELRKAYPGTHATSNAAFLSAAEAKRTESSDYRLGTTVDQIAARHLGADTKLPSLELAMDLMSMVGQCDNGYACVYQNNLSWASPTDPLPAEAHPRLVFESLFGEGGTPEQCRAALRRRGSLLDSVVGEFKRLGTELGAGDRERVAGYLDAVREIERRVGRAEAAAAEGDLPDLDRPTGVPASYAEHARLMFDLQILALRGDVTRVTTFQLARETSNRTYVEAGVNAPHHPLTHHGNDPAKVAQVAQINRFHVGLFAEFLKKLAAVPEAGGSLLDHVLYLYGSGMGDPNVHDHTDLPVLVAGGAAGNHVGGRHVRFAEPTPLANLHLTLLHEVGVPAESFGDSRGTVAGLLGGAA